ncbi:glycoside hydrolase [Rhodobacteraceae bacterium CCMM004]|nr:glycoside hydrolase [Rhodobacteraceae bacterium CCMM004]
MTGRRAFVLGAAALAACGRRDPAPVPVALPTGRVIPPNFGDSDPHPWDGRAPEAYGVHGIDASRWQTGVDWARVRAAGGNFAFLKATEGGDRRDPMIDSHWAGTGAAGIPRGAYHVYYLCTSPERQAEWFLNEAPGGPGALPAVLDAEWNPRSPTCRIRPPGDEVRDVLSQWLRLVQRATGQRPIVYTTPDYWADNDLGRMGEEFWLRSTAGHPGQVYPGARWRFWQYTATGIVPGVPGPCDINVFNGSPAAWQTWLAARQQR